MFLLSLFYLQDRNSFYGWGEMRKERTKFPLLRTKFCSHTGFMYKPRFFTSKPHWSLVDYLPVPSFSYSPLSVPVGPFPFPSSFEPFVGLVYLDMFRTRRNLWTKSKRIFIWNLSLLSISHSVCLVRLWTCVLFWTFYLTQIHSYILFLKFIFEFKIKRVSKFRKFRRRSDLSKSSLNIRKESTWLRKK